MLDACVAGAGIAQIMQLGTEDWLAKGLLVELFPDWNGEVFPLYAVYPSRHHRPAKVRAFVDFVVATIRLKRSPLATCNLPLRHCAPGGFAPHEAA